jgi:hypothetical protein
MPRQADGYHRFLGAHLRFAAIAQALEMLEASHPEQSRTAQTRAAIAKLERLTTKFGVTLRRIRVDFTGN